MKINRVLKAIRTASACLLLASTFATSAADVHLADNHLEQENYQQAITEYRQVAKTGNAHAYYQLGAMNYLGLGTAKNSKQAMVWYSLAAAHYYKNSGEIVGHLRAELAQEQYHEIAALVKDFQAKLPIDQQQIKYLPQINETGVATKISFVDEDDPTILHSALDKKVLDALDFSYESDPLGFSDLDEFMDQLEDPTKPDPYFLVVDAEVAPDGSLRDFSSVQTMGDFEKAMDSLHGNKVLEPIHNGNKVPFIHRSHLGLAAYDIYKMKEQYPNLKIKIKRMVKPLKGNPLPKAQYQYAMVLTSFKWLTREAGEIDALLKSAAEAGYSLAQYELGLKLYREQQDPKQAIYWLTQASEQGVAKAQYRLGRLLLESPWLVNDEAKALHWLAKAAENKHSTAMRKVAEIKLLAKNEQLRDVDGAIDFLAKLEAEQKGNAEYQFLQAIAYNSMEPRDRQSAVSQLKKAIYTGSSYNWDVSEWQQRLSRWTTGSVTITEL